MAENSNQKKKKTHLKIGSTKMYHCNHKCFKINIHYAYPFLLNNLLGWRNTFLLFSALYSTQICSILTYISHVIWENQINIKFGLKIQYNWHYRDGWMSGQMDEWAGFIRQLSPHRKQVLVSETEFIQLLT